MEKLQGRDQRSFDPALYTAQASKAVWVAKHFYCRWIDIRFSPSPKTGIGTTPLPEEKGHKDSVTVLYCCNSTGSLRV